MITLYQAVERNHDYNGVALTFKGKKIKFNTLVDNIDIYASKLYAYGVRKDQVVTLVSPNIPETIYTFYALNKIGAIALVVHPLIPAKTLKEVMESVSSTLCILPDARYNVYAKELEGKDILLLTPAPDLNFITSLLYPLAYHKALKGIDKKLYLDRLPLSKTAFDTNTDYQKASVYLRSGGTTGNSKTIVLNDEAINNIAFQCHDILEFTQKELEGKKMLGVLPIFHGFGLAMGVHAPLANRATSALMISFDAKTIVKMIGKNQLTFIILIPYMARKLLSQKNFKGKKLQNLTHAFIGGDKTDLKIFKEFDERMKEGGSNCILMEGYGLTETVTVNYVNLKSKRKVGSVGTPLKGVRARIVDSESMVLKPLEYGQIELDSAMMMKGYLFDDLANKEVFDVSSDGTKWLKTGDIGMIDEEGYLYFKQRSKEMYKIAGMNVFPSDIETIALRNPLVKEATVIFYEDEKHPYVTLFIESDSEDQEGLKTSLYEVLNSELIKYSVPEKLVILKTLPRTNVGKVDKVALKNQYNKR